MHIDRVENGKIVEHWGRCTWLDAAVGDYLFAKANVIAGYFKGCCVEDFEEDVSIDNLTFN
jgi:hypothetical protein